VFRERLPQEMIDEDGNIVATVSQRGQPNRHDVEPVEEVLAK
jgi:hypothetical protein